MADFQILTYTEPTTVKTGYITVRLGYKMANANKFKIKGGY